jgi:DNA repair protein RadC
MSIKTWPETERPREKLLHQGAAYLSDAELLAIFLRTGCKGKNAVDLARDLLSSFGSLGALLNADIQKSCRTAGIGLAKHAQLQAILEINKRYLFEKVKTADVLTNSKMTKQYLIAKLGDKEQEIFAGLFLNAKHQIIDFKELFRGSLHHTEVYPREIIKTAIMLNACAIILTHNHPSGDPTPSQADIRLTKRLQSILPLLEIRVLDHVIIGKNRAFSLSEAGLI